MDTTEQLQMTAAIGNQQGAFKSIPTVMPDGIQAHALPSTVRLVPAEKSEAISRSACLAAYFLKCGLNPALLTVKSIYRQLKAIAFATQQNGDISFFEKYPDVLIRSDSEKSARPQLTREELMRDYKIYCSRLAHKIYHYLQISKLWTGTVINAVNLYRINGVEKTKTIAEEFKFTQWNSKTAQFASFPQPVGYTKAMTEAARIAIGKTSVGVEIAAIPIIQVSVFGNLGQHTPTIVDLLTNKGSSKAGANNVTAIADISDDSKHASDAILATSLLTNMDKTIKCYANAATSPWKMAARDPFIENGSTYSLTIDEVAPDYSGMVHMNVSGNMKTDRKSDNFCSAQNQNYEFWQQVMFTYFPEMRDTTSDLYVVMHDLLHLVEKQLSYQEITDISKQLQMYDINSLSEAMSYKRNLEVNTATIVRYMPPITDDIHNGVSDDSNFKDNWERYDVISDDNADVLRKSKAYPDLTPAVFMDLVKTDKDDEDQYLPFVLNSVSKTGAIGNIDAPVVAPYGSVSTLLDLSIRQGVDFTGMNLEFIGYSDAAMQSKLNSAPSAFVASEDPSYISVLQEPVLDNTDIFSCGFTLILSDDNYDRSEWALYLKNAKLFPNIANGTQTSCEKLPEDFFWQPDTYVPQQLAYTAPDEINHKAQIAHTANPGYLSTVKHAFVFLGAGLLTHPIVARSFLQSGNPVTYFNPKSHIVNGYGLLSASARSDGGQNGPSWCVPVSGKTDARGSRALDDLCTRLFNGSSSPTYNWQAPLLSMMAMAGCSSDIHQMMQTSAIEIPQMSVLYKWMLTQGSDDEKLRHEQYVFNPAYGPVTPIVEAMPLSGFFPNAAGVYDSKSNPGKNDPYAINIPQGETMYGFSLSAGSYSQNDGENTASMCFHSAFLSNVHCATFWMFYLDSLTTKNVRAKPNGLFISTCVPEAYPGKMMFSTEAKSLLALLSRGMTEGAKKEDTRSLYNEEISDNAAKQLATTKSYDLTVDIVIPPRITRDSRNYSNNGVPVLKSEGASTKGKSGAGKVAPKMKHYNSDNRTKDRLDVKDDKTGRKSEFDGTLGSANLPSLNASDETQPDDDKTKGKGSKADTKKNGKKMKMSITDLI